MAKLLVKFSLFLLIAGIALLLIGISTSFWVVSPDQHRGLWKYCSAKKICKQLDSKLGFDNKLWATRVLEIVGFLCSSISVCLLLIYIRRDDGLANLRRIKCAIGLAICAALCILTGIAVYCGLKNKDGLGDFYHFGWSFILAILAGIIHLVLVVPLVCEIIKARGLGAYESI